MKTILTLTASAIFAVAMMSGCATDDRTAKTECVVEDGKLLTTSGEAMNGCVMMRNGRMMMMDGKLVPMRKNMTMPDGTLCMVNGTCVMKGGGKRKLTEGEVITPKGDMFHIKGLPTPGEYFRRG